MKLDPRSIPYRAIQTATRWAFGAGAAAFFAAPFVDVAAPLAAAAAAAAAGLVGVAWAVAYHRRFSFELTADSLDITSGVVARRTREIPLGRIQNVDIRQGVVPRLLGVAEVRFETAGGSGTEASLAFVDLAVARDLQERVDRHDGAAPGEADDVGMDARTAETGRQAEEPLYAIAPLELALLSVTSVDWRALGFVVLAGAGVLPDPLATTVGSRRLSPVAVLAQPLLLGVAGIAGNAALLTARFFRFRLWRAGETLRYERGLFRRFSGSIPLDRVHLLRLRDNPATRRLGFAALDIETAGYGPDSEAGTAAAVPIAERRRVLDLARSVEPFPDLAFERPPARARVRYAIRYAAMAGLVTAGLFAVDVFLRDVPWFLGAGLLAVAPVAAHLTWRHRGYVLGERALLVRAGFWRRHTHVVPLYRVQTVGTTATVFQRRWSLSTVRVDTAGGAPAVHDLDAETARTLRETVAGELLVDRARRRAERRPSTAARTERGGLAGRRTGDRPTGDQPDR